MKTYDARKEKGVQDKRSTEASQGALVINNPPANAGDARDTKYVGRIPWNRKWQPIQHSCLENSMDRGAWQVTVYGVAKSWTQLSN